MTPTKIAIDPLWQCLCPSWTSISSRQAARLFTPSRRPALQPLKAPNHVRRKSAAEARRYEMMAKDDGRTQATFNPLQKPKQESDAPTRLSKQKPELRKPPPLIDYSQEPTMELYTHMRGAAIDGKAYVCRFVAEMLVKERGEKPSLQLYNTLILSNISPNQGMAWRVHALLEELEKDGLQPDIGTCHAVLKVLSVHVDHLLRNDVLEYMSGRWYQLSEDGAHDVAAGLLREGLFEQALQRLDMMRREGMHVRGWLLDMCLYVLCEAPEISEAYRIMRQRVDASEYNISKSLWTFFLDKASEARHHAATALAWSSQVNQNYINPSSGICLNVLTTAAQAADAVLATEVFTQLSKRGSDFQPVHYELLISAYLATQPPDLKRALSTLTIMALEKVEPSTLETRSLYLYLRDKPALLREAIKSLRDLHEQGRRIPISALNLLIECYVHQRNLADALKLYKQIHTFVPISEGAKKTFANIETFNILLKGCREVDPPDVHEASFLVSELLALRVKPTELTFDRLILVFMRAGSQMIQQAARSENNAGTRASNRKQGHQLIDSAFRHFADMRPLGWLPRFGTLEDLSIALAKIGDERCWDVLQAGEDSAEAVDGWEKKGGQARRQVEQAWASAGKDHNFSKEDMAIEDALGEQASRESVENERKTANAM